MDMKYSGEQLDWEDVLSNCCEEGQQIGANGLSVRSVNTCWSPALHDGSVANNFGGRRYRVVWLSPFHRDIHWQSRTLVEDSIKSPLTDYYIVAVLRIPSKLHFGAKQSFGTLGFPNIFHFFSEKCENQISTTWWKAWVWKLPRYNFDELTLLCSGQELWRGLDLLLSGR